MIHPKIQVISSQGGNSVIHGFFSTTTGRFKFRAPGDKGALFKIQTLGHVQSSSLSLRPAMHHFAVFSRYCFPSPAFKNIS
jgi:hypothetical protein